jgi:hypothetical protein
MLNCSKLLIVAVLIVSTISCVYIPYPVPAEVKYVENATFPEDAILTLGPRDLLADVAESITERDSNIEVVDGQLFRDTAFPKGNWILNNILMPETCNRINKQLDVDYLVVVSTEGIIQGEEEGFYFLVGAMVADEEFTIDAILLDLKTAKSICQISSEAHGKEKAFIWIIVGVGAGPTTRSSAITVLGEEIANVIRERATYDKVRIAIMAAEQVENVAIFSRKEYLLKRYDEGDKSFYILTELALLGATEPLEQLAWKGDVQSAIYLYNLTGISGPLNKLAEDGNQLAIAQKSGVQSKTYQLPQQKDIKVEQNENNRKLTIKEKELESKLTKQAEAGDPEAQFELYMHEGKTQQKWLCRSADQGYTGAAMWLGYVFETGTYGFPIDDMQSYLWYRRAAIGQHQKEIEKEIKRIKKKSLRWSLCKGAPCGIAQKIVDLEGKLGSDGVSRAEYKLEQWEPGQCEQQFVGTE